MSTIGGMFHRGRTCLDYKILRSIMAKISGNGESCLARLWSGTAKNIFSLWSLGKM